MKKLFGLSILLIAVVATVMAPVQAYGEAQIQWVFVMSNMGCVDPFYVQVTFHNFNSPALWVGLSFRDVTGKIYDVPPQDVSYQGTGSGIATFVYAINGVPTSDGGWFKQALSYRGMQYAVALWHGFDGAYMNGWIDRTGWRSVPGC